MGDPRAVVAFAHFPQLVGAHLVERRIVRTRIVLDRNLRRHAAHRVRAPPMARADQKLCVRPQERRFHRHLTAVGQHEAGIFPKRLDRAEDVIPSPAVEAGAVLSQLVEDLVHLECGRKRFDQHRRLDGPGGNPERRLRVCEDVVPEARFEMTLELREVEIWARPGANERIGVVEQEQAARADHQRRRPRVQLVALAGIRLHERNCPAHGVDEVVLAADDVGPGRRVGVFEVRHEHLRT